MDRQRPDMEPNADPQGDSPENRTDELPAYPPAVAVAMGARQVGVTAGIGLAASPEQEPQSTDEDEGDDDTR